MSGDSCEIFLTGLPVRALLSVILGLRAVGTWTIIQHSASPQPTAQNQFPQNGKTRATSKLHLAEHTSGHKSLRLSQCVAVNIASLSEAMPEQNIQDRRGLSNQWS